MTSVAPTTTAVPPRERVRSAIPWWAKLAVKLAIARLPVHYTVARSLALAKHGGMDRPAWAYKIFRQYFDNTDFPAKAGGFTLLEMGPGDSLFSALIAKSLGAESVWLVDVDSFANLDVNLYRMMSQFLMEQGLNSPDLSSSKSIEDVLAACSARYLTNGLASWRQIASGSVDFIFSNTVLQHIARPEVGQTFAELRRVIHLQGCAVHVIDFRDMMGQSLHHLRFSERVWESRWFRNSGCYTNRFRLPEMLTMIQSAGFDVASIEVDRWSELPIPRSKLASPYREMPEEHLLPKTARLELRPRK